VGEPSAGIGVLGRRVFDFGGDEGANREVRELLEYSVGSRGCTIGKVLEELVDVRPISGGDLLF